MKKIVLFICIFASCAHAIITKKAKGEIIVLTKTESGVTTQLVHNKVAKLYAGSIFIDAIEVEIEGDQKKVFEMLDQEFNDQQKKNSPWNSFRSIFQKSSEKN